MSGSSREQGRALITRFLIWFPRLAAHTSECLVRRTQIAPSCKAIYISRNHSLIRLNHLLIFLNSITGLNVCDGGGKDLLLPKSFSQSAYCSSPPRLPDISGHIIAHLSFVNILATSKAPYVLFLFVSPLPRGSVSSSSHPLSMLMALLWLAGH